MEENTKTNDEAPEVMITRAKTGKVENANPQTKPSDTLTGLLVIMAFIYIIIKIFKKI